MKYSSKILISNPSSEKKLIILEPWAEEHEVFTNQTMEIKAESEYEGNFEIEFMGRYEGVERILIHAWSGCILEAPCEDKKVSRATHIQVPDFR